MAIIPSNISYEDGIAPRDVDGEQCYLQVCCTESDEVVMGFVSFESLWSFSFDSILKGRTIDFSEFDEQEDVLMRAILKVARENFSMRLHFQDGVPTASITCCGETVSHSLETTAGRKLFRGV